MVERMENIGGLSLCMPNINLDIGHGSSYSPNNNNNSTSTSPPPELQISHGSEKKNRSRHLETTASSTEYAGSWEESSCNNSADINEISPNSPTKSVIDPDTEFHSEEEAPMPLVEDSRKYGGDYSVSSILFQKSPVDNHHQSGSVGDLNKAQSNDNVNFESVENIDVVSSPRMYSNECLDLSYSSKSKHTFNSDQISPINTNDRKQSKRKQASPQHMSEPKRHINDNYLNHKEITSSSSESYEMKPPMSKFAPYENRVNSNLEKSSPQSNNPLNSFYEKYANLFATSLNNSLSKKSPNTSISEELNRNKSIIDISPLLSEIEVKDMSDGLKRQLTGVIEDTIQQTIRRIREAIKIAVANNERLNSIEQKCAQTPNFSAPSFSPTAAGFNACLPSSLLPFGAPGLHSAAGPLFNLAHFPPPHHFPGSSTPRSHGLNHLNSSESLSTRLPPSPLMNSPSRPCGPSFLPPVSTANPNDKPHPFYPLHEFHQSRFFDEESAAVAANSFRAFPPQFPCMPPPLSFYSPGSVNTPNSKASFHGALQSTAPGPRQNSQSHPSNFFSHKKDAEQNEAIPLVVNAPKRKRTKVTDTRLCSRSNRTGLLADHSSRLENADNPAASYFSLGFHTSPSASSFRDDVLSGIFPGAAASDRRPGSAPDAMSPDTQDSMLHSSPSNDQIDVFDKLDEISQTSTLTPVHLRKAKLMFFYTRYPSSSILKAYFPDVKFNKNNTAQLVKWFSNFREFYYIQMEKYARMAITEGIKNAEEIQITLDSELYRILNLHYNRNNQIEVPDHFRNVVEATLREFFKALFLGKDQEPSWKKPIYKVIARMDQIVPEFFKSPNWVEQLVDN